MLTSANDLTGSESHSAYQPQQTSVDQRRRGYNTQPLLQRPPFAIPKFNVGFAIVDSDPVTNGPDVRRLLEESHSEAVRRKFSLMRIPPEEALRAHFRNTRPTRTSPQRTEPFQLERQEEEAAKSNVHRMSLDLSDSSPSDKEGAVDVNEEKDEALGKLLRRSQEANSVPLCVAIKV